MFVDFDPNTTSSLVSDYVLSWGVIAAIVACTCSAVKCAWAAEDRAWRRAMANAEKILMTKEEVLEHLKDFTIEVKSYKFQQKYHAELDIPTRRDTDLSMTDKTVDSASLEDIRVDDYHDTPLNCSQISVDDEPETQQPETMLLPSPGISVSYMASPDCFQEEPKQALSTCTILEDASQLKAVDPPPKTSKDLSTPTKPAKGGVSLCCSSSPPLLRNVPNQCAVCLDGYKLGNRVTWSPNPKCPHVFHESCIVEWLASRKARPDDEEGPKRVLTCPCCRQPFLEQEEKANDVVLIVEEEFEDEDQDQKEEKEKEKEKEQELEDEISSIGVEDEECLSVIDLSSETLERNLGSPARAA